MANCKICGLPVRVAPVFHTGCWQKAADDMAADFCDNYCHWPYVCEDSESLQELHCDDCPMIRVLNLGVGS